jgi:hypothetical protein
MKNNNLIKIILFVCGICLNAFANKLSVPNVYIEAQGNNNFEAKIRANKVGIRQSIDLFLDKIDVKSFDVKQLALEDLKNICQISRLENENSQELFYSATVDYTCDSDKLRKAITTSQNAEKVSNFYEVLIIPVLKNGNKYFLWNDANLWYLRWQKHKALLNKSNVLVAEQTNEINSQNILKLNYNDIANIYPDKLFNKVVIVICDLFEKRGAPSHLHVKYKILNEESSTVEEENYSDLSASLDGVQMTFDDIINSFHEFSSNVAFLHDFNEIATDLEKELDSNYDKKKYTLYMEGYDISYIEQIKEIINNISQITTATFTPEAIAFWKVELWGDFNTDEEFAECLYTSGLTYRRHLGYLSLIKLDKGV